VFVPVLVLAQESVHVYVPMYMLAYTVSTVVQASGSCFDTVSASSVSEPVSGQVGVSLQACVPERVAWQCQFKFEVLASHVLHSPPRMIERGNLHNFG
jgi:hypothetical protein